MYALKHVTMQWHGRFWSASCLDALEKKKKKKLIKKEKKKPEGGLRISFLPMHIWIQEEYYHVLPSLLVQSLCTRPRVNLPSGRVKPSEQLQWLVYLDQISPYQIVRHSLKLETSGSLPAPFFLSRAGSGHWLGGRGNCKTGWSLKRTF